MTFDPRNPLPRTTVANIRATASGQASPVRLRVLAAAGFVVALLAFVLLDDWWLAFLPLAASAFGAWGLAQQATQALDVRHAKATGTRTALRLVRVATMTLGVAALALATILVIGTAVEWEPLMDWLGR